MVTRSTPSGPLVGIQVLDFCSFIAGSFGAMLLGDLGADVIKIEALTGDACRSWGPFLEGESRAFQGWNRNKRSLAIDLRREEGRQVVHRLVRSADVAVENFRPGVTTKLAIDYETLREINPRLIYASSTAFGSTGPHARRPGYDPVLQSLGGSAFQQTQMGERPAICSVAVSDYAAAILLFGAVNAALFHRQKTGEGQLIETSLLQAIMAAQSHLYTRPLDGEFSGPGGIFPYEMFKTAEGPLFIAAGTDKFWRLLCDGLGRPDLAERPEYETNPQRVERAEELRPVLNEILAQRSALAWEEELVDLGVPCAAVRSVEEFFSHEQVEALGMNPVVEHPRFGRLQVAGHPVSFAETPARIQSSAPTLGQHSREVLRQAGFSEVESTALIDAGIVRAD